MKRLIILFLLLLHVQPAISFDDDDDDDEFPPSPPPPPLTNRYMKIASPGSIYKPDKDNALIIFDRVLSGYSIPDKIIYKIWDITHKIQPKFVAMLSGGMKAAYRVKPGHYKFMAVSHIRRQGFAPVPFIGAISWALGGVNSYPEAVTAEVVADKTYFIQTQWRRWGRRTIPVKKGQKTTTTADNISVFLPIAEEYQERAFYDNSVLLDAIKASDNLNKLDDKQKTKYALQPEDGR